MFLQLLGCDIWYPENGEENDGHPDERIIREYIEHDIELIITDNISDFEKHAKIYPKVKIINGLTLRHIFSGFPPNRLL